MMAVMKCIPICSFLLCMLCNVAAATKWTKNSSDSCYEERGGIFPCSATITGNIILMLFYGGLLGIAAKLISDGAELLLDLGFPSSIVGGVILPLLGAVPDSAMIVASGMGSDAQEKLSVGMGTLAGSTVMLLTVAWAGSLALGKCDLNERGESIDGTGSGKINVFKQGITPAPEIKAGVAVMLATSLFYFVIQIADWRYGVKNFGHQPSYVRNAALATMVLCFIGLIAYIIYSLYDSKRTDRIARIHREEILKRHVLHTLITLAGRDVFKKSTQQQPRAESKDHPSEDKQDGAAEDGAVANKYFKAWHMKKGMRQLKISSGGSDEDENEPLVEKDMGEAKIDVVEEIKKDEPEESKQKIAIKSAAMLLGGVALVTIFADPMCEVLSSLTNKENKSYIPIGAFYVSFVVMPFCSNASELVSSLIFASKKKRENATLTYSQLFGASTMNNTMCLGIFMALVYIKDLQWYYSAEVICIVAVQWVVGLMSLRKTYVLWMAVPVAVTYVLGILIVYLLEHQLGWR